MTVKKIKKVCTLVLIFSFLFSLPVRAVDYEKEAEERKSMEIESNSYENWPLGPAIGAEAAILMDAGTGSILYAKNIHEKLYPASITKLLTTYIAAEKCDPEEMVTFSEEAIQSIHWWEDANMGVDAGTSLTMEEVLYGILVGSANEAAYAVAEHISGSMEDFAVLMNKTARELGCTDSNFVTPNGIHDKEHYTSAYDMALIAKAFFQNEMLEKMSGTTRFEVPVNESQPKEGIVLSAKSQLLPGKAYAYEPLIGTKTGYTEAARQTLVSCAEKNGLKLICVILKEETPAQFTDTIELFNYGFENFEALYVKDMDGRYNIEHHFFTKNLDLLGSSKEILSPDKEDYVVLPDTVSFEDLTSEVVYNEDEKEDSIASVNYYYKDHLLGKTDVRLSVDEPVIFDFSTHGNGGSDLKEKNEENIVYINVIHLLIVFIIFVMAVTVLFLLKMLIRVRFAGKRKKNKLRKNILHGDYRDFF